MSTPIERVTRLLDEGGRFMVELPGQASIDLTPDVIAALAEVQSRRDGFEPGKESIPTVDQRRDVPTGVQIP
jgi:hypothetical protein